MIYVARSGSTDFVKIGFAVNVTERLDLLQCGNPLEIVLLRTMEGDRTTEAWLHFRFRALRHRSEWFRFCPEMLSVNPPCALSNKPLTSLGEYLSNNGISFVCFAQKLGTSPETVRRYSVGERMPRPEIMHRIVSATSGKVTLVDLVPAEARAA